MSSPTLPAQNRIQLYRVDLGAVAQEWVRVHGKHPSAYDLPEHDKPLRQDDLPDDAKVAFARIEQDDETRRRALRAGARSGGAGPRSQMGDARILSDIQATETPDGRWMLVPSTAWNSILHAIEQVKMHGAIAEPLLSVLDSALQEAPARNLVIGVESEEYPLVATADAAVMPFDYTAFAKPTEDDEAPTH
jgi:hypothetical protein